MTSRFPLVALAALLAAGAAVAQAPAVPPTAEPAPCPTCPPCPPPAEEPARAYVVEQVVLLGNEHTQESEIRRHILVAEGDVLDDERVILSRLRLLQLGYFSQVETRVQRGTQRGRVILVFALVERNTLLVSDLVLGSTAPQPIYGGVGLSQQNFLGLGLALSGALVWGGSPLDLPAAPPRFSARASFFNPDIHIGNLPRLVFGVNALWLRGEEFTCPAADCRGEEATAPRLSYLRAGGDAHFGVRPGPFERLLGGVRYERLGAGTRGAPDPIFVPSIRLGASNLVALVGTYDRDTRNDFFFPTEGTRLLAQILFSSRAIGSDYEYSRYLVQAEKVFGLPWGHALRTSGFAGAVQGDAPFFDRFFPADFAYFSVGPALGRALDLNFSTDSRYDSYLLLGGAEYGIPLWGGAPGEKRGWQNLFQQGYLAIGARWLWTVPRPGVHRTAASRSPLSGDIALRLDTPFGIFNLSLGYLADNLL